MRLKSYHCRLWLDVEWRYQALDNAVLRVARKGSLKFVCLKLGLEASILHPASLAAFFGFMNFARGGGFDDLKSIYRRDFLPTLGFELALWAPLDVALFTVVPLKYQMLTVDLVCLVESTALSWVSSNGMSHVPCDTIWEFINWNRTHSGLQSTPVSLTPTSTFSRSSQWTRPREPPGNC